MLRINIKERSYNSWTVCNTDTLEQITLNNFDPIVHKLFNNDTFTMDNGNVNIVYSTLRINENIPGVLILDEGKTYGRENKPIGGKTYTNRSLNVYSGRLLYKCIPDDKRLPIFLVPFEIKKMDFNKDLKNMYVTIKYKHWNEKHPYANVNQMIGPVDILDHFYEYQLYCKSLATSISKFNQDTKNAINNHHFKEDHDQFIAAICQQNLHISDRTNRKTFTIDPNKTSDYDDAVSIKRVDNHNIVSVYIANVSIFMDFLNLWSSFSKRISTIYLPDCKRPMLPTILSDCLCSLQSGKRRITLAIDIEVDDEGNVIDVSWSNVVIRVFNNYVYEELNLLTDFEYISLFNIVTKMAMKYENETTIKNSHDLVSFLMILTNNLCAKELIKCRTGIFRTTNNNCDNKELDVPSNLPEDVTKFIKGWRSVTAQYVEYKNTNDNAHEMLNLDVYTHITSPIRRLVDLLNLIELQTSMGLHTFSKEAHDFYNNWISQLDYINTTMRSIRKVQNDCSILNMCVNDDSILRDEYDGYSFDKMLRNDGLYQYFVYLPKLKITSKITLIDSLDNYENRKYKLFIFNDEESFKRKIRLQLL